MNAKEFQSKYSLEEYDEGGYLGLNKDEISRMLIDFAKYHHSNTVEAIKSNVLVIPDRSYYGEGVIYTVDYDSISDAYPESNIK